MYYVTAEKHKDRLYYLLHTAVVTKPNRPQDTHHK